MPAAAEPYDPPAYLAALDLPPLTRRLVEGLAVTSAGDGPPLVLVHGGSGSWTHWARNIGPLSRRFAVHAVDLPGHGDSPAAAADISLADFIGRLEATVAALIPAGGRINLAAFSFGTALTIAVAAKLGDRVAALSLLGPGGFPLPADRPEPKLKGFRDGMDTAAKRAVHRHNLGVMMLSSPDAVDALAIDIQAHNVARRRFRHQWRGQMNESFDHMARMTCRLQLVWGEADPYPWPDIETRLADCRKIRPDLEAVILPGAGHWAQFEDAEGYNRALGDFLAAAGG